ncbi:MAG: PIG-L family deacetylase, partial [Chloroflexi bacterium]|nr:PIG-L family deacetylase [Chloroflexota bacterium]
MEEVNTILVVTPHPDDAESGAGASIARWTQEGKKVVLVVCTDGRNGTSDRNVKPEDLAATREKEQREAAEVLGISEVVFLRFPDQTLDDTSDFREKLVQVLEADKSNNTICIVVDNIDRLDSSEALAILRTVKTFIVEEPEEFERIVFIVPCDPEQIVDEARTYSLLHNRPNEVLRKYFNVFVHIPHPMWPDLHNYLSELLADSDISLVEEDVAEIASALNYVYGDNPRQAKQFTNNLIAQHKL